MSAIGDGFRLLAELYGSMDDFQRGRFMDACEDVGATTTVRGESCAVTFAWGDPEVDDPFDDDDED